MSDDSLSSEGDATALNQDVDNLRMTLLLARNIPLNSNISNTDLGDGFPSTDDAVGRSSLDSGLPLLPGNDDSLLSSHTIVNQVPANHTEDLRLTGTGNSSSSAHAEARSLRNILASNERYTKQIELHLNKINQALQRNRDLQRTFQVHMDDWRRAQGLGRAATNTSASDGVGKSQMIPGKYFAERKGALPPPNEDTERFQRNRGRISRTTKPQPWLDEDKRDLRHGVREQYRQVLWQEVLDRYQDIDADPNVLERELAAVTQTPNHILELDATQKGRIDWDDIAKNYCPKWSAIDCQIQWESHDSPLVDKGPWTKHEDKILLALASKYKYYDWEAIAKEMPTKRTPIACLRRYQRSLNRSLLKKDFTPEDDAKLMERVRQYGDRDWQLIAMGLEGRNGSQCMHRWNQTLNPSIRRGRWTEEEDLRLQTAVEVYGTGAWAQVKEHVPGRTDPQCRERWVNVLDPSKIQGSWTAEEDSKLVAAVQSLGMGRWAKVANLVGSRTDNQCWRRWKCLRPDDTQKHREALARQSGLVSNFAGRSKERPQLTADDFVLQSPPRSPAPPAAPAAGEGSAPTIAAAATTTAATTSATTSGTAMAVGEEDLLSQIAITPQGMSTFQGSPGPRSTIHPSTVAPTGAAAGAVGAGAATATRTGSGHRGVAMSHADALSFPFPLPFEDVTGSNPSISPSVAEGVRGEGSAVPGSLADLATRGASSQGPPNPADPRPSPAGNSTFPPAVLTPLPPTPTAMLAFRRLMSDVFPEAELNMHVESLLPPDVLAREVTASSSANPAAVGSNTTTNTTESPASSTAVAGPSGPSPTVAGTAALPTLDPSVINSVQMETLRVWLQTMFVWPMATSMVAGDSTVRHTQNLDALTTSDVSAAEYRAPQLPSSRKRKRPKVDEKNTQVFHVMVDDSDLPVRASRPIAVTGMSSRVDSAPKPASPQVRAAPGPLPIVDDSLPASHMGRGRARSRRTR